MSLDPPTPAIAIDCTCAALRKAARRLSQAYDAALAAEGLKTSQYSIVSTLARWPGPPPPVQTLADVLALDRTTLGHNLQPLRRSGLVRVAIDVEDRRIRRVLLTPAGLAKLQACEPLWRAAQARFDDVFGAERSASLRRELSAIAHGLDLAPLCSDRKDTHVR